MTTPFAPEMPPQAPQVDPAQLEAMYAMPAAPEMTYDMGAAAEAAAHVLTPEATVPAPVAAEVGAYVLKVVDVSGAQKVGGAYMNNLFISGKLHQTGKVVAETTVPYGVAAAHHDTVRIQAHEAMLERNGEVNKSVL